MAETRTAAPAPEDDPQPVQQFVGVAPSTVCSLIATPLLMTGLMRDVLTRHFAAAEYVETPDLRHLIWKDNPTTGILIESYTRWYPDLMEKRPAVVIKRNAYQNQRIGIDDRHQPTRADRGINHYATLWVGSHTAFCIGGSGAQAELLATEVQRELTEFGPAIRETMQLHRFAVMEVGAISELEDAAEHFVVPVTVSYAFQERWVLRPQAPILKRISLSMILDF